MRSINFQCPNPQCRVALSIPSQMQGQRVRCAGCGQSFLVPPAGLPGNRTTGTKRRKTNGGTNLSNAA